MTTKQAIEKVLAGRRKPMRVPAIIEAAVPLATGLKGRTPGQVIYSVLYSEAKKADGLVVQTGRGEFKLRPRRTAKAAVSRKELLSLHAQAERKADEELGEE